MGERSSGRPATHDGLAGWEAVLDRERLEWELVRVVAADLERLEEGERDVVRAEMQRLEVRAELLAAGVSEEAGEMGGTGRTERMSSKVPCATNAAVETSVSAVRPGHWTQNARRSNASAFGLVSGRSVTPVLIQSLCSQSIGFAYE